jgi:hypothetical protein
MKNLTKLKLNLKYFYFNIKNTNTFYEIELNLFNFVNLK